jgi:5-formyltetrahydrofolate cyclo-ligase family
MRPARLAMSCQSRAEGRRRGTAPVDLVVCGSVAVNRQGARIGKGGGFSDLEVAFLIEAGVIRLDTVLATTVHVRQVVDEPIPETIHDFRVDIIVTPNEAIWCAEPTGHRGFSGSIWMKTRLLRFQPWRPCQPDAEQPRQSVKTQSLQPPPLYSRPACGRPPQAAARRLRCYLGRIRQFGLLSCRICLSSDLLLEEMDMAANSPRGFRLSTFLQSNPLVLFISASSPCLE